MKKWNMVGDIHTVRGARIFPYEQFVMGSKVSDSMETEVAVEYKPVGRNKCNLKGMWVIASYCPFKLVSQGAWPQHGLITVITVIFDARVKQRAPNRCASYHTMSQWVITYYLVKLSRQKDKSGARPASHSLRWDSATLSPFLTSISHFVINYWSPELSKKRVSYPENKLNLSCPLIENTLYC